MTVDLKPGDIMLLNRHGEAQNFYSVCQRFFTKKPYTHTALVFGEVKGFQSVISSDEVVAVLPVRNYFAEEGTDIEIWRFKDNHSELIEDLLTKLYTGYADMSYGYLQIPWFIYRWFMESVFQKDVRKQKNWSTSGVVCSELIYVYLECFIQFYPELKEKLDEWNQDTVSSGDMADIIHSFPEIFELIYKVKS